MQKIFPLGGKKLFIENKWYEMAVKRRESRRKISSHIRIIPSLWKNIQKCLNFSFC